ncbi:copper-containing nitrite reductase [Bdellovibrio svalbardensis]|uniref:Copper-containing nitrite reductase n=1 Tax=Bdellovibrio svalbardensis TaxID=2972972 RepID=A0ABT6DJ68_9BACT|nr:copper-containing nitrite reductase [Bdellovibrio svalbardensis]MDG0816907.1 copper-containing nitrite reductase [Bdellovibrio svalbardensis]
MKFWNYKNALLIVLAGLLPATVNAADAIKGEEVAVLTDAPEVPPPITRKHSTKVIVNLETKEVKMRLADGVDYTFWTFGGKVPGKFIRIREGDQVEFHLHNHPSSKLPHNIDLHAVTGQGGGAEGSFTAPGHSSTFNFKALNAGLYVYHCATAPVGMHIGNGMYGLILVEPKDGLPKVDREFYVMQSEFYTKGKYGAPGLQPFSMAKAVEEKADYVVFNGNVGAITGDKALKAKVGDSIRLFVGNGGPNLVSSFHVIGEIFDKVYVEGGKLVNENVQTTLIPAGGSAIVEFKTQRASTLILVDHSIFRAFNKGALGMIKVEGEENKEIYSGKTADGIYQPEGGVIQEMGAEAPKQVPAKNLEERLAGGKRIFDTSCFACHQSNGQGLPGAFPPLAGSDFLNKNKDKAISAVIHGLEGPVKVNGKEFNSVMPAQLLSDEDAANVLTYVYSMWGNSKKVVTPEEVKAVRAAGKK